MKTLVARALAKRIKDGQTIGLGSGSTVELAIDQIQERISREKLRISGVPTSHRVALIAAEAGINVLSPMIACNLDWAFDGADEIDNAFNMIKGRGGAMLNEKIMARRTAKLVIIVGEDKLVETLGKRHPVPVEVIPEAMPLVRKGLLGLGARDSILRNSSEKYGPLITEHNNLILDTWFDSITPELEAKIKQLTGVVESGLFIGCTDEVFVARADGVYSRTLVQGKPAEVLIEKA